MGEDLEVWVQALKRTIGTEVVFMRVRVYDVGEPGAIQCPDQFPRSMGTTGVNQDSIQKIGGGPIAAAPGKGLSQVKAGHGCKGSSFKHDILSLPSLWLVVKQSKYAG